MSLEGRHPSDGKIFRSLLSIFKCLYNKIYLSCSGCEAAFLHHTVATKLVTLIKECTYRNFYISCRNLNCREAFHSLCFTVFSTNSGSRSFQIRSPTNCLRDLRFLSPNGNLLGTINLASMRMNCSEKVQIYASKFLDTPSSNL